MGCLPGRDGHGYVDEFPPHDVWLSSFRLCRFLVTQREWHAIMGNNPSRFKGDDLPVTNVNWHDCQQFIARLNEISGEQFRLPTEAEWEYAARGGQQRKNTIYAGSDHLNSVAWCFSDSIRSPQPVGRKSPNELGLYDMTGNVHEWCEDSKYNYTAEPVNNPLYSEAGERRVTRGGSWINECAFMRISQRTFDSENMRTSTIGLRLAMST